jgi:phosphoglycerate dehydrogenase-like enzyme
MRGGVFMAFKMVILPPSAQEDWPEKIMDLVPGAEVKLFHRAEDAMEDIEDADAAYGTVTPELFARAKKLRWVAAPMAGLGGQWFHEALVNSDVVVTNIRGIYSDHISAHIMAFLLAFSRHLDQYISQQYNREWNRLDAAVYLPESTALIIGVGGIGSETARLCAAFGMRVIGVDPRTAEAPPYVAELHRPEALDSVLGRADFVILTTPETPGTRGMMNAEKFRLMKPTAYFINIGRGACVVLDDLVEALESGRIAGAGLDVFQIEPLPPDHPLWTMPGVLMTPHVASNEAPYLAQRRTDILMENCRRFAGGEPLANVVDKANWF